MQAETGTAPPTYLAEQLRHMIGAGIDRGVFQSQCGGRFAHRLAFDQHAPEYLPAHRLNLAPDFLLSLPGLLEEEQPLGAISSLAGSPSMFSPAILRSSIGSASPSSKKDRSRRSR